MGTVIHSVLSGGKDMPRTDRKTGETGEGDEKTTVVLSGAYPDITTALLEPRLGLLRPGLYLMHGKKIMIYSTIKKFQSFVN